MGEKWDSIKDTIMEIKKKREETKRKRETSYYGMDVEAMLVKSLSEEIDKAILKEIMNKFK